MWGLAALLCAGHAFLSGCSVAATAAAGISDNLSVAIVNQPDPELVGDALPAYLLLIDGFVLTEPDNASILGAAAQLYTLYGTALVADEARAAAITACGKSPGPPYSQAVRTIEARPSLAAITRRSPSALVRP